MRKEPHMNSAQRKLAKQAGKAGNPPTGVMDVAAPTANLPRQLEVETRSSMRRPAAKAIKIAKIGSALNKAPLYLEVKRGFLFVTFHNFAVEAAF
jgi:hypothetical protein